MIIVEGADNAGKTTLVRQLIEEDPRLRLLNRERFKPERGESIGTSYIEAMIPDDGDRVAHGYSVADRLLASECIYGELFRGGCRMSSAEHFVIRNMLESYRAIVIHCQVPESVLRATWDDREQLYERPLKIARSYRDRIKSVFPRTPVLSYDWTKTDAVVDRRRIINTHERLQRRHHDCLGWWSAFPHGVGRIDRPKVIFIGEEESPRARVPVPFANGPAGDFLSQSLELVNGLDLRSAYFTNAHKGTKNDASILREELLFLLDPEGTTRVVLLGRRAQKMFEYVSSSADPPVRSANYVPHPMYWKRFQWKDREQYPELLTQAMGGIEK